MEASELLTAAMKEVSGAGGISIHGKNYKTVATRVEIFRKHFGTTARMRIAEAQIGDNAVRMTAVIELRGEGGWELVAEGRAEEIRTERGINSTSALEVCETSAYGRALANLGLHGGEFASANEVEHAIEQQKGDRSGRPDTSKVDPDIADQYAQSMWDIVQAADETRATKLHWELNQDEALYTAATDIYRGICKTNKFSYGGDKWKKLLKLTAEGHVNGV